MLRRKYWDAARLRGARIQLHKRLAVARWSRGAAVGLVVAGLSTATALGEGTLRSNLTAMVQSASDLIAQRSPGIRTRAIMGKGKYAKFGKDVRYARALPRVRTPGAPGPLGDGDDIPAPAAPFVEAAQPAPPVLAAAAPPGGFFVPPDDFFLFAPVPGPGIVGGGPGGGIIIGPPGEEGPVTPPVTPPGPPPVVPEPASWAMMLLGFGALGAILRRQRHVRRTHHA